MESIDEVLLSLKPLDLIRLGGTFRIVRETTMKLNKKGKVSGCLTFSIRRCSWTNRPYTVMNAYDIKALGIELIARNVKLKHGLNSLMNKDVLEAKKYPWNRPTLTAYDVVNTLI